MLPAERAGGVWQVAVVWKAQSNRRRRNPTWTTTWSVPNVTVVTAVPEKMSGRLNAVVTRTQVHIFGRCRDFRN